MGCRSRPAPYPAAGHDPHWPDPYGRHRQLRGRQPFVIILARLPKSSPWILYGKNRHCPFVAASPEPTINRGGEQRLVAGLGEKRQR